MVIMRLLLALLLLVFAVPSPGNKRKDQAKPEDSSGQRTAQATNAPEISPPLKETGPPITETKTQTQEAQSTPKPQPFMSHAEWIMSGLTAVYVILTGVYVLYSRKTLKELQRQIGLIEKQDTATQRQLDISLMAVEASQKSAEAAMLSAKSKISSERSWLLVAIDETEDEVFDPLIFKLRATNHGNSPAEILWVYSTYSALYVGEDLPEEPNYGFTDRIFGHRRWIPSGEGFDVDKLNIALPPPEDPVEFADLQAGRKWLWSYGVIRYRDSISPGVHESRFCYLVNFKTGPRMEGPAGYNDCT